MRTANSCVIALGLALCACAPNVRTGAPEKARIVVQAFKATRGTVVERYAGSTDAVGFRYAQLLAERLQRLGYDATAVPEGDRPNADLYITGHLAEVDGGSTAKRLIWGMGAGMTQVDVFGEVTSPDGTLIGEFTESRRGGRGWTQDQALDDAMRRSIKPISRMIYTGQYRRNAPPSSHAAEQFKTSAASTTPSTPPSTPLPAENRLRTLDRLRDEGIITPQEHDAKKKEILKEL